MTKQSLVAVVDDDESVRESLPDLLKELGFGVVAFPSAKTFLASDIASEADCILLDITMPEMSGPSLQQDLARRGRNIPIVFITAHVDEKVRQRVLDGGAVECLFKPFSQESLLHALKAALGTG